MLAAAFSIAGVDCAFVVVFAVKRCERASSSRVAAGINCTPVSVIANDRVVDAAPSSFAGIASAIVVIVTVYGSVMATTLFVAYVVSARILVVALNGEVNTSNCRITFINGASVVIVAINPSENASNVVVTRVACAQVVIVANGRCGDTALKRVAVGLETWCRRMASHWRVYTTSCLRVACINCAFVVVIAACRCASSIGRVDANGADT